MAWNAQGFLWGTHATTWNGCRVLVLDTTKEGLLVHVGEGTPSQGDEQAGRMLEVPRGAFWGLGLEGTAPVHTEQTREDNEVVHMPTAYNAGGPGAHRGRRSVHAAVQLPPAWGVLHTWGVAAGGAHRRGPTMRELPRLTAGQTVTH